MRTRLRMMVHDWHAWAPDRVTRPAWRAWAAGDAPGQGAPDDERAAPLVLPMMLRRRVSPLGQKALAAALPCGGGTEPRYVFASRHGEFRRTLALLDSVIAGDTPSPAEFSLSVHHVLAGLLSIHAGNRRGHSAVAAGADSFGFAFLEASSCLADRPGEDVLLVYCDEPLDGAFASHREASDGELPLVLALRLGASGTAGTAIAFGCRPAPPGAVAQPAALDFLRFLLGEAQVMESNGERMTWRWSRAG